MTDVNNNWIQHLLDNPEELDPELKEYLQPMSFGEGSLGIKHPLVNEIFYNPMMNPHYNQILRAKRRELTNAKSERRWTSYLMLIERPWRAESLVEIADELTDQEYWETVSDIWTDTENLWQWDHIVEDLLLADRPGREHLMSKTEQKFLAGLPEWVTVFRGHNENNQFGWSWTTDPEKGIWFARRLASLHEEPAVSMASIHRNDIIAVFLNRGESEIVLNPAYVEIEACVEINESDEPVCECGMPTSLSAQDQGHALFHKQQMIVAELAVIDADEDDPEPI